MVDQQTHQTYQRDGYCLIHNLIPRDVIAALRARILDQIDHPPAWWSKSWQVLDPSGATHPAGHPYPIGIQLPARHDPAYETVARHPNLAAAMTAILGGPVELLTDQVGVKHGFLTDEQGGRSCYHQDSYYWHIAPQLGAKCWIPLDEVGPNAIALAVKPGTQRDWKLEEHENYHDTPAWGTLTNGQFRAFPRHRIPQSRIDYSDEIIFRLQPGDGLFFTNYTWHRSEPNRTGQTKMFYAIAYQLTAAASQTSRTE